MTFFFFSHRQLFQKMYTIYSLFFVFFFLCLCFFCFLSCFFFKIKNNKFSSDYGGAKSGFAPHLNYWGRVPGLPPESTPMSISRFDMGPSIYDVHTEGVGGQAQVDACGRGR